MENFTLKASRRIIDPSMETSGPWSSRDTIYKRKPLALSEFVSITCLQSVSITSTEYFLPIDTPFVEEQEVLDFYLDFLTSLGAFDSVDMSWEREGLMRIGFDPKKVSYDYLVILNSLLRNCHSYWHVPYQFYEFSSWDLDVDPLKLLVLAHYVPPKNVNEYYLAKPVEVSKGNKVTPKMNGEGHSLFYKQIPFELASSKIKLTNPFISSREVQSSFSTRKGMTKFGYYHFVDPSTPYKYTIKNHTDLVDMFAKYPNYLNRQQVENILNG